MLCKNCKHWKQKKFCDVIEDGWGSISPNTAVIDVRVADDSGLSVRLRTGPEFGCVKFDQRKLVFRRINKNV